MRMKMRQLVRTTSVAITLCSIFVELAAAQEPSSVPQSIYPWHAFVCPDALLRGCCNIYCPKPIPCIKAFCRGCCKDCYCSKPYPCIPCYCRTGTSYCYCNKPGPDLCRPIAADYFTCVERRDGCAAVEGANSSGHMPTTNSQSGNNSYDVIEVQPAPPLLNYSN
jgi:hypothetical protein